MQSDLVFIDAVDAVDRRGNIDFVVSIAGRYILTRHLDPKGNQREGPCRVVKFSPDSMTLVAPVKGLIGEGVIATVWELGTFKGSVLETDRHGFVMSVEMSDEERNKFATKIEWYEKHKNDKLPENRKFKRIVPRTPGSTILLSDGTLAEACIVDVSVSGVAVTAGICPELGEPLAVGKIVGRVVRHFAGGFAIEFVDLQKPQLLEILLLAPAQS